MRPTIQTLGPSLVDEDLARLELELGCALPDAYRRFLLAHNGGVPTPQGVWVRSSNRVAAASVLFGVGVERTLHDVLVQRLELMRAHLLPSDYLPIGREVGGDYLLLVLAGPDRGAVVTLPHHGDLVRDDGVFMRSELLELAPDFDVLLDAFGDEDTLRAALASSPPPQASSAAPSAVTSSRSGSAPGAPPIASGSRAGGCSSASRGHSRPRPASGPSGAPSSTSVTDTQRSSSRGSSPR